MGEGFEAVVICADDTEVFIICLTFRDNIHTSLFQKCGSGNRGPNKYTASSSRGKQGPPATQVNIQCRYCGRSHPAKSCPAYGKQSNRCKGWNQFAIMHEHRTATVDRQVRMVNNKYEDNECLY